MINLNNWAVTLPTGSTHYPIKFNEFIRYDGLSLLLLTPCDGEPTKNSDYPRSELREIINGEKASWDSGVGNHHFEGIFKVDRFTKTKPVVSVFQIHDGKNDQLQVLVEPDSIKYNFNGIKFKVATFNPGEKFRIKCKVKRDMIFLKINFEDPIQLKIIPSSSLYFKAGNYLQSNSEIEKNQNDYSQVSITKLKVKHSLF